MLFKRDVNWNPSVVLGTGFGAFCDWYLRFNCPKHGHGRARYRPDPVCLCVCLSVTDFSDFYEAHMRRPRSLFLLVAFQLGFSGIPENHEKTEKSYLREASRRTPFWDPFLSLFSEKVSFFPRRPGEGPASRFSSYQGRLRRNPARRVNLVYN